MELTFRLQARRIRDLPAGRGFALRRDELMLRNVKIPGAAFSPRFTAIPMTSYPFGADRAELEKAFARPSVASAPEDWLPVESLRFSEFDRAVALFEHPDH